MAGMSTAQPRRSAPPFPPGCPHPPSNAQTGTGVAPVAGGLVGNAVFGSTLGTVGGAAAGALIGNEVGKNNDRGRGRRGHRH